MRIRRREYEMPAPPREYEEKFPQVENYFAIFWHRNITSSIKQSKLYEKVRMKIYQIIYEQKAWDINEALCQ